jgi:hypothetical protein
MYVIEETRDQKEKKRRERERIIYMLLQTIDPQQPQPHEDSPQSHSIFYGQEG